MHLEDATPVTDDTGSHDHDHHQSLLRRKLKRKPKRPLHARIAPSGPRRRPSVAEIVHPQKQDTAPPPPLSPSAPTTVAAIIKTVEAAAPPPPTGITKHLRPLPRGPPSPLPTFVKFSDLKEAGIVKNHCALRILIARQNFPVGRWLGNNRHVWTVDEIEVWLATRPTERPAK